MNWPFVLHLIIILNILDISQAVFESCEQTVNIAAIGNAIVQSPGYPTNYTKGSSCRYTFVAPVDFQITATCNINMYDPSKGCSSERFYIAVDGKKDLSTSTNYCGSQTVTVTSKGNQIVLAYVSTTYGGLFRCTLNTACDCGWSVSSRVLNGVDASPNEFTPMTGLFSKDLGIIFCGATIVSGRFVLTAAHCLRTTTKSSTEVVVGEHDVRKATDSSYTQRYIVDQFIEYPTYSSATDTNDLALIKTTTTISWSRGVSPVCLPFLYTSSDFAGQIVTAAGWGTIVAGGPLSNVLKKVNLNVLSNTNTNCTSAWPALSSSHMCTYTKDKDTCQYDSGGPLFYRGPSDPRLFLIAIVCTGNLCGASTPSLNTRLTVTAYLNWIESYTGGLCRRALA